MTVTILQSSSVKELTEFLVNGVPYWIALLVCGIVFSAVALRYISGIVEIEL